MIDTARLSVTSPDDAAAQAVHDRLGEDSGYGRLVELAALLAGAGLGSPTRTVLLRPTQPARAADPAAGLADRARVVLREVAVPDAVDDAFAAGMAAVDAEVDAGADLLLIAGGDGHQAMARAAVGVLTGSEPVHLVGWPAAGGDGQWMTDVVAVRDARRRAGQHSDDAQRLLTDLGDSTVAAITGMLLQAAVRRTLVVLDGVVVGGAAMAAHRLSPAALSWWVAADRSLDPTLTLVQAQLGVECVLDLDLRVSDGTAALLAADLLAGASAIIS